MYLHRPLCDDMFITPTRHSPPTPSRPPLQTGPGLAIGWTMAAIDSLLTLLEAQQAGPLVARLGDRPGQIGLSPVG